MHPSSGDGTELVAELERLRRFDGPEEIFWAAFLACATRSCGAGQGHLLVRGPAWGSWSAPQGWPAPLDQQDPLFVKAKGLAAEAMLYGYKSDAGVSVEQLLLGVRLDSESGHSESVLVFLLDTRFAQNQDGLVAWLRQIGDIPARFFLRREIGRARRDVVQFAEVLDLMVLLNEDRSFIKAAMTFCNELASRFRCQRVSLGWLEDRYVRVRAISHMERFEKKMDIVQALETAMEECCDQDEEIVWPPPPGCDAVYREHQRYLKHQGGDNLVSLPLRLAGEPMAVLCCERMAEPFRDDEVLGLRLFCDQAARRLADLHRADRWFGARLADFLDERLSALLRIEHTLAKLVAGLGCIGLLVLLFGSWEYRISAPFLLKTDAVMSVPAPFDGYIEESHARVGDLVAKDDLLLTLDSRELLLSQASAEADRSRYAREVEKARAKNAFADMKIAMALEDQAKARLQLIEYHLGNVQINSPIAGIVVDGDLSQRLGSPVRKGEMLYKIALLEKLFVELEVDEKDIHEISEGASGTVAFASRPESKFPIAVQRIEPVAIVRAEGNVFVVRARLTSVPNEWWRPGMSGVAKVSVGERRLLWIFTHRTVDFFRMLLWW